MRTITFYSYKGGTGRTLLLANLAVLAASLGRRVVAMDFDLEAPGLPYKFGRAELPRADGLVGWMRDFFVASEPPASLMDYVVDLPLRRRFIADGWLKMMPSGRAPSPNYFQDLERLHLDHRLDQGEAIDALVDLQDTIEADLDAELLLIDARTGITPTNAVTTHVLADDVVALTLRIQEQLDGTRSVLRSLKQLDSLRTRDPLRTHLVLSRLPPKPPDVSPDELTENEKREVSEVRDFLNEPAQPLKNTLTIDEILLLHTDLALGGREFLFLEEPGRWTRSALHVDYWRIAQALLGPEVERAAAQTMESARSDAGAAEELAHFFVAPDRIIEARGAQIPIEKTTIEPSELGVERQIEVLRRRAEQDETLLPGLASLLYDAAHQLASLGRHDEALRPITEAVEIREELAATSPVVFRPQLAISLDLLAECLSATGEREKALGVALRSLEIEEDLAKEVPAGRPREVAISLHNVSALLRDLGRASEAIGAAEREVALRRSLVGQGDDRRDVQLSEALDDLGSLLGAVGRPLEALDLSTEAVEILRAVVSADSSDERRARLAIVLNNHAVRLHEVGRFLDALEYSEEAVALYRGLEETAPGRYRRDLATALMNLSTRYAMVGRGDEAVALASEAVPVLTELLDVNPKEIKPQLGASLHNQAALLAGMDRDLEALHIAEAAVEIYRELVSDDPGIYDADFAKALGGLANRQAKLDLYAEALTSAEESLTLWRGLTERTGLAHAAELATALGILASILSSLTIHDRAVRASEESVEIRRTLERELGAAAIGDELAAALSNHANFLGAAGRTREALEAASEAVTRFRQLDASNALFRSHMAIALGTLVTALDAAGRVAEAAEVRQERLALQRELLHPDTRTDGA